MANKTLNVKQKQRRDTAANWTSNNPVLLAGELGFETDTKKFKMGDGSTAWNSLGYINKSIIADYTLTASNWNNNSYTLSVTGKTANNNAIVSNSNTGTNQEVLANANAIADANIYKITDNGTSLTLVCETTPTTNLKIQVEVY